MTNKPSGRSRTAARLAAVQALFQIEQGPESSEQVIDQFLRHRLGKKAEPDSYDRGQAPDANADLFAQVVRAASHDQAALDGLIGAVLPPEWKMDRLDPVLRAVLRAGCAELREPEGPPGRVVINEYVDVSHGFFQGDETGMANALLDKLARQLRRDDFGAPSSAA